MPTNDDPVYLDSSAIVKLVRREVETGALAQYAAAITMVTYDRRMATAARNLGFAVVAPGQL